MKFIHSRIIIEFTFNSLNQTSMSHFQISSCDEDGEYIKSYKDLLVNECVYYNRTSNDKLNRVV